VVGAVAVPSFLPVIDGLRPSRIIGVRGHLRAVGRDAWTALVQVAVSLVTLAHQARLMGDAVTRTLVRLTITRKHLLEWTAAAHAAHGIEPRLGSYYRQMRLGLALAAAASRSPSWSTRRRGRWLPGSACCGRRHR
jgi:cyclic beta-1,2-glucan synthetase